MNTAIFNVLLIICPAAAASGWGLYLVQRSRLKRDVDRLRDGIRNAEDGILPPGAFRLATGAGRIFASIVSVLLSRVREAQKGAADFSQLVLLSKRIAAGTDSPERIEELALQLLADHCGRDIAGGVLFRKSGTSGAPGAAGSGSWTAGSWTGIPQIQRLLHLLQSTLDRLEFSPVDQTDTGTADLRWGYQLPRSGDDLDLSVFGIGLSLFVPLQVDGNIAGAVWLGFHSGSAGLDAGRRRLIRALAEHIAASLESAERARMRAEKTSRERDFLVGLSHDLRAPSTVALLAVQELQLDSVKISGQVLAGRLQTVERCLRDQLSMLDDVLDLSRHRHGLIEARIAPVGRSQFADAAGSFIAAAEGKGIRLIIESGFAGVGEPRTALADANHFKRIVGNLISNAVKYTDKGQIAARWTDAGEWQELQIEDSGRGIAAGERGRLFQPFSRLDSALGREGTGIGLAISRILAEINGGSLKHADRCGGGSIFSLRLRSGPPDRSLVFHGFASRPESNGRFEKALIIDDDAGVCRMVRRMLDGRVKTIVEADCLEKAKVLAGSDQFDLIISDYLLGDGTAAELFSYLDSVEDMRDWRKKTRTIVLSGGCIPPDCIKPDQTAPAEAIQFLQKPISREQLIGAICG